MPRRRRPPNPPAKALRELRPLVVRPRKRKGAYKRKGRQPRPFTTTPPEHDQMETASNMDIAGGVAHTEDEIAKVRARLEAESKG